MDKELEDLESVLSEHFGRTPVSTPFNSQDFEDNDENNEVLGNDDRDCHEQDDVLQTRVRSVLRELSQGSDDDDDGGACGSHNDLAFDETDPDYGHILKFKEGCGCSNHCEKKFSAARIYESIMDMREKTKEEKEMFLIGLLSNCTNTDSKTKRGKKRTRPRTTFIVNGVNVCKATFQLCFDVKRTVLYNLIEAATGSGVRTHGNKGKRPKHALSYDDVSRIVTFLLNYAEENGIPYPAAPRGNDNVPVVFLSSDTTKASLHKQYVDICVQSDNRFAKLSSFKTIWNNCVPHIKIAKPREDMCGTCERLRKGVSAAVTEEEKLEALQTMEAHIFDAQKEREIYLNCVRRAQTHPDEYRHYTFDFSQCVSLPHYSRQMGPLYFLTLRKVQIFGFRISGGKQYNFLIDETDTLGDDGKNTHGPNAVLSMIDWAIESRCSLSTSFAIHADNCPGQNKNQYVIGYFVWRTMTGQQEQIEYLMQIPGHARCHVDSGFANVKKCYKRSNVETTLELASVVDRSAGSNEAVMYPTWCWRDWKSFLGMHFKSLPQIRKYQYFRMTSSKPGMVTVKERIDGEEQTVNLLRSAQFRFTSPVRPDPIPAAGLSNARRQYLQTNVSKHVSAPNRGFFG